MSNTKWQSVTKQDLIIEVWEAIDCESVGRVELERIQKALIQQFGAGADQSPASIARAVADEGAVLRHPEVLQCDYDWRVRKLSDENLAAELRFTSLPEAIHSFARVEELRIEHSEDAKEFERLRKSLIQARDESQLAGRSKVSTDQQREAAREIAEWLSVWLRAPQLFADWLDLRMRSAEFKKKFPQITPITQILSEK